MRYRRNHETAYTASDENRSGISTDSYIPFIWLFGILAVAGWVLIQSQSYSKIRTRRPLTDQKTLDLLEDCKEEMGVRTYLAVIETSHVKSPSLFGFIRPRLLLPEGSVENLGNRCLRHIFLHELAHLKRHDIPINWLMTLFIGLHWFNPLIWYAFSRMRADREMACDALTLAHIEPEKSWEYGKTIVHLLEKFSRPRRIPGLAAVLEEKSQIRRRITMITKFKKHSLRWSIIALALITALGCVTLTETRAKPGSRKWNRAFTKDPKVTGKWKSVDFVKEIKDFQPSKKSWKGKLYLKGLTFYKKGRTSGPWKWSKGYLWHPGDRTEAKYQIKKMNSSTYLFMEWMSGDVTIRKQKPKHYVLQKVKSDKQSRKRSQGRFLKNKNPVGSWTSVDFVGEIDDFVPDQKAWTGNLFLKNLTFLRGGKTSGPWTWDNGYLWHPGDKTKGKYWIKEISGSKYLFMEWMSGDVTIRKQKPSHYVLKKN